MPRRKAPESKELTYKTQEELEIEAQTGHKLSMRQKRFADRFAEGNITATGAAIEAGYSPKAAAQQAPDFDRQGHLETAHQQCNNKLVPGQGK